MTRLVDSSRFNHTFCSRHSSRVSFLTYAKQRLTVSASKFLLRSRRFVFHVEIRARIQIGPLFVQQLGQMVRTIARKEPQRSRRLLAVYRDVRANEWPT